MTSRQPGWPDDPEQRTPAAPQERPDRRGPLAVFGPGVMWTAEGARRPEGRAGAPPAPRPYTPPIPPPARTARHTRQITRRQTAGCLLALALVVALCVGSGALLSRLWAFGSVISPQAPASSQTGLMSGP